jgi:hypothetical protein
MLHPSTPLKRLAKGKGLRVVEEYVSAHFGVDGCLLPHRPWRVALKTGAVLTAGFVFALVAFPYGLAAVAVFILGTVYVVVRRFLKALRMSKYRVRTLGDLVKCICTERKNAAARPQAR